MIRFPGLTMEPITTPALTFRCSLEEPVSTTTDRHILKIKEDMNRLLMVDTVDLKELTDQSHPNTNLTMGTRISIIIKIMLIQRITSPISQIR